MFGFGTVAEVGVLEAFDHLHDEGHVLLDVRGRDEVAMQGIEGALNIPLGELEQKADTLTNYASIDIICRSGGRSAMAAQLLEAYGVKRARSVSGGLIAWMQAGLPLKG